jgi:hypothetical protein
MYMHQRFYNESHLFHYTPPGTRILLFRIAQLELEVRTT